MHRSREADGSWGTGRERVCRLPPGTHAWLPETGQWEENRGKEEDREGQKAHRGKGKEEEKKPIYPFVICNF